MGENPPKEATTQLSFYLPSKSFILVRHAQTTANLKGQACGRLDSPLTKVGYQQAVDLALKLQNILNPSRPIIHTGLARSEQTAQIIAQYGGMKPIKVSDLSEHDFGELEGQPWTQTLLLLDKGLAPPGGETRVQFVNRSIQALAKVLEQYDEPLIVAHGGTFFALTYAYGFLCRDVKNCEALHFLPKADKDFPWETRIVDTNHLWHLDELVTKKVQHARS